MPGLLLACVLAGTAARGEEPPAPVTVVEVDPLAVYSAPRKLRRLLDAGAFPADPAGRIAERQRRVEAIERVKGLLGRAEGDAIVKLLHRLAELDRVQGEDLVLAGLDRWDAAVAAGSADRPGAYVAEGAEWLMKSVRLRRQLAQNVPRFVAPDENAWAIGRALLVAGRTDEGVDELKRLLKAWPESRYAPDAWTRVGDVWFDRSDAFKSMTAFQHAEAAHDPGTWPYARYMLDWCHSGVGDVEKALDGHHALAALPLAPDASAFERALRAEVLVDLGRFSAASGKPGRP